MSKQTKSDEELAEKYASILLNDCGVSWETRLTVTTRPLFERAIAEARKGMWTDKDMMKAHNAGWRSAYYKGERQHEADSVWLEQYRKERKGE